MAEHAPITNNNMQRMITLTQEDAWYLRSRFGDCIGNIGGGGSGSRDDDLLPPNFTRDGNRFGYDIPIGNSTFNIFIEGQRPTNNPGPYDLHVPGSKGGFGVRVTF